MYLLPITLVLQAILAALLNQSSSEVQLIRRSLIAIGNFDVAAQTASITFPTAGTWFDYLNGNTITATGTAQSLTLQPGEYHVYLNRNINNVATPVIDINNPGRSPQLFVYPNPVQNSSVAEIFVPERGNVQVELWNAQGQKVKNVFTGSLARGKHTMLLSGKTDNLPGRSLFIKSADKK